MKDAWMLRRAQGVWGVLNSGTSEGTHFSAQHTLLQVCHPVAAVPVKGKTISAW